MGWVAGVLTMFGGGILVGAFAVIVHTWQRG